jgi:hypothetical protein
VALTLVRSALADLFITIHYRNHSCQKEPCHAGECVFGYRLSSSILTQPRLVGVTALHTVLFLFITGDVYSLLLAGSTFDTGSEVRGHFYAVLLG